VLGSQRTARYLYVPLRIILQDYDLLQHPFIRAFEIYVVGNPEDTSKEKEIVSDSDAIPSFLEDIEDPPVTKKGKHVIREVMRKAGSPGLFAVLTTSNMLKVKAESVETAISAEADELEDGNGM
jgi:hypothetical protein